MIHISEPSFLGNERQYVMDCIDRRELSWHGDYVTRFEEAFADFCGCSHAIACCNGSAALHLALIAAGVKAGDDVYLPALTYIATANAVRYVGARPVFCDVDPDTWCLDPKDVLRKLQAKPRCDVDCGHLKWRRGAILPVHLYGVPANMDALRRLGREFGLPVVEDASEAHGAVVGTQRVGALGDVGTFSFFANKILATGEGGMVTTNSALVAATARHYRGQCQTDRRFMHDAVGYNYRITNIQAALGLAQLEQYDRHASIRAAACETYRRMLTGFQLQECPAGAVSANWLFAVLVPEHIDRDSVIRVLDDMQIETRPVFPPLTMMAPYLGPTPPVTAHLAARGLCLPTHASLTRDDVEAVARAFKRVIDGARPASGTCGADPQADLVNFLLEQERL